MKTVAILFMFVLAGHALAADRVSQSRNVDECGAVGNGRTDDTRSINSCISEVYAAGGGVVSFTRGKTYVLHRANPSFVPHSDYNSGTNQQGGVQLRPGVSLEGNGATLLLEDNCDFINFDPVASETIVRAHVNTKVASGATTIGVDSTTPFRIGTELYYSLYQGKTGDPHDDRVFGWAKVTEVGNGTITINTPLAFPAPFDPNAKGILPVNTLLYTFLTGTYQNQYIRDFNLVQGPHGNTELALYLRFARNVTISDIRCTNPGAGCVAVNYSDGVLVRDIHVDKSDMQNGQLSKGVVVSVGESKNVQFDGVYGSGFKGTALNAEAYSSNIKFTNIFLNDTDRSRSVPEVVALGNGTEVQIENLCLKGLGGNIFADNSGSGDGSILTVRGLEIASSKYGVDGKWMPGLHGPVIIRSGSPATGTFRDNPITYHGTIRPVVNTGTTINLPDGLYRSIRVYSSTTAGITGAYSVNPGDVNSSDWHSILVAGKTVLLNDCANANLGMGYGNAWNTGNPAWTGRQIVIYTDGHYASGGYLRVEAEYWPVEHTRR